MKYVGVTPVLKTDDTTDKANYRPISILPHLSKVYERLLYNQFFQYFDAVFPNSTENFGKVLISNNAS